MTKIETSFRSPSDQGSSRSLGTAFFVLGLFLTGLGFAATDNERAAHPAHAQPEAAGPAGAIRKSALVTRRYLAVTANQHASEAADKVLAAGGNALDAALAAQWTVNLVEPQSSGIGGGAFLLYWDARKKQLFAWDGRETAPAAATEHFARKPDGSVASFDELVATGKAVGTPGLVAMLEQAHRAHGRRAWRSSFSHAIGLAEAGFPVSPRLHKLLSDDRFLRRNAAAAALFYDAEGKARPVGERLRNPALAHTFRQLARSGSAGFYRASLGNDIVAAVRAAGGDLTAQDLAAYQPRRRDPVCGPYRGYRVCGMPAPSSGAVAIAQLLGILERSGGPLADLTSAQDAHRFAEAGRLVFADRARYMADPAFVTVPQQGLLAADYLAARAALIDATRSMGTATAGELAGAVDLAAALGEEIPATTHFSIVDREGNAVAMTSSVEAAFGSRIMVGGFLLNNQLTDFSFVGERDGKPVANRLAPGKRPLSSMAPTIVFGPDQALWAVLGSSGGQRIINYVAQSLLVLIDGGGSPELAVAQAHVGSRNGPTEIESGGHQPTALAEGLRTLGHTVRGDEMTSGTHLIVRNPTGKGWIGAADPRREGIAMGR
ncbi:MAG: gamma-glutamyltransferase [Rhodocyclaceae bacterium]|nr:gamma-glutamyltransferase [Rhodocyclaceae bacterium]